MPTPTSRSSGSQLDRDDAGRARPRERGERRLLDRALARRHEHVLVVLELLDRQHRVDALAFLERQQVHDRLAARAAARLRQLVDLEPVDLAAAREAQQRVVRVRDEQLVDEVLVLDARWPLGRGRRGAAPGIPRPAATSRSRACDSVTTTSCGSIRSSIVRSDVVLDDLGAALVAVLLADLDRARRGSPACSRSGRARMSMRSLNIVEQLLYSRDLVLLEPGQAVQAQVEDRLRLRPRTGDSRRRAGPNSLGEILGPRR